MPKLIKHRTVIEDDSWNVLLPQENGEVPAHPPHGDIVVAWPYWQANRATLDDHPGQVGVWLGPADEVEHLAEEVHQFPLVAIHFPVFSDGRGYSTARLLRERYGYQGEVRAVGDVLRDQLHYLKRCGFDAFAVRSDRCAHDALAGLDDFADGYQVSVDRPEPLFRRRLS